MTKEDSILHVVQAFKDGKEVQARPRGTHGAWAPNTAPSWNFMEVEYRVKPEVVEVVGYAIINPKSGNTYVLCNERITAIKASERYYHNSIVVELRGSYEKE